MSIDASVISLASRYPASYMQMKQAGLTADHFNEPFDKMWKFIERSVRETGNVPSADVLSARFEDLEIHRVKQRDLPMLTSEIHRRKKFLDFTGLLLETVNTANQEDLEQSIAELQGGLNTLSLRGANKKNVVDIFSKEISDRMMKDIEARRRGEMKGIPTGFHKFDTMIGGLHAGRMVVVMARPGIGKSWLSLLFVANAIISGHRVVHFPLEMTLEETIYRLYTIFSSLLWGQDKVLKNLDLTLGRITVKRVRKFQEWMEDKYSGQLFVADVAAMSDPYTPERIEAEVSLRKPHLYCVDYLTLMKAPGIGRDGGEDFMTVKALSNACKGIAQRHNCVGQINAQVNRESMKVKSFLPRVEHLAYGDSIGQDADQVVSINRQGEYLYYSVVKNRHGPEIGKTKVNWQVDRGIIEESADQDGDDDE